MLRLLKSSRGFFLSYLKIKRLSYIQIGSEVVAKEYPNRREYAVWEEVLNACLKEKYIESNNTVMTHIARLREKMHEPARKPKYVKTVWGVGYKIEN